MNLYKQAPRILTADVCPKEKTSESFLQIVGKHGTTPDVTEVFPNCLLRHNALVGCYNKQLDSNRGKASLTNQSGPRWDEA